MFFKRVLPFVLLAGILACNQMRNPLEVVETPVIETPVEEGTETHTFVSSIGIEFEKVLFVSAEAALASEDFKTFLQAVNTFKEDCKHMKPEPLQAHFGFTTEKAGLTFYIEATKHQSIQKPHIPYPGYDPFKDPDQIWALPVENIDNWWTVYLHATCDE